MIIGHTSVLANIAIPITSEGIALDNLEPLETLLIAEYIIIKDIILIVTIGPTVNIKGESSSSFFSGGASTFNSNF